MTGTVAVETGAIFVAAAALVLQLIDAVTALVDMRRLGDDDEPDALTRTRARELAWTLAVTVALAVAVAYGVDFAARVAAGEQRAAGVLVLAATGSAAFLVGLVAVVAVLRREKPTYARLRRDLRDRSSASFDPAELAAFAARLRRADVVRARRPVAATVLRIVGVVVVASVGGASVVVALGGPEPTLAVGYLGVVLLDLAAFVLAVRAAAVRRAAIESVLDTQRAEVAALLERARIPRSGRVPGLRDRVSRALAILREKQN